MFKRKKVDSNDKYQLNVEELKKIGVNTDSKSFKKKYEQLINRVVAAQSIEDLYGENATKKIIECFVNDIEKGVVSPTKKEKNNCIEAIYKNFQENKEEFDNQNELLSISSELISLLVMVLVVVKVFITIKAGNTVEFNISDCTEAIGFFLCLIISILLFKIPKSPRMKKYLYLHAKNSVFKIVSGGVLSFGYVMFLLSWSSNDIIHYIVAIGLMLFGLVMTIVEPIYFYFFRFKWINKVMEEDVHITEKNEPQKDDRKCV